MILICPNCSSRYLLSSSALGEEGREVRCAKCDHEWFARPDTSDSLENYNAIDEEDVQARMEALREDLESDDDEAPPSSGDDYDDNEPEADTEASDEGSEEDGDIPNSVKPIPDDFKPPAHPEDVLRPQVPLVARMAGYGAAAGIFMIIILAGFIFKRDVVTMWPPSAAIYELAGMPVSLKGEGLVIETLSATLVENNEGQENLIIKGRVINLTRDPVEVPPMIAIIRSTNGENGESWIIDPPADEVQGGASFAFTSDYPNVPKGAGSVNLTFVPVLEGTQEASAQ